ncbi:MAG TPA: serine/threonine-protein kinase [Candidatus Binatia bacterium]|nr:serine/threonine-protein kinase [Candidatus Binatia bacterium]
MRKAAAWSALLCALLGLAAGVVPGLSEWFKAFSFDALSAARHADPVSEVMIVALDEESYSRLGQSPEHLWDRTLHARLLDTLIERGARAVVFDVFFAEPWSDSQVDELLAQALERAKGKVVLAASQRTFEAGEAGGLRLLQPTARLAAAAPWGVAELPQDTDGAIRRQASFPERASLGWKTAELLGAAPAEPPRWPWLNYYGPGAFRQISYWQAMQPETLAPEIFSNKVVFVGRTRVITTRGGNSGDEYRTPLTRWTGQLASGVEIQATAFVNLWRRDWLREPPPVAESGLFIVFGVAFGFGLALLRPVPALAGAAAGVVVVGLGSLALFWTQRLWFPWVITVAAQIPFALVWSVLGFVLRAAQAKDIPDHTLLRCVGRGGYGEVWLARDAIGGFHAVKIVYRKNFPRGEPFEREFRGMQTFAPLSRLHPGLVHILHVGRNDLRGCFYYIMEAADDEVSGAAIKPERYAPRTLARELDRRGRLPVGECVHLGASLASAVDYLHQHQLIHRDVKPANIIFVNGQPKLADVGLVTTLGGEAGKTTQVGTVGYVAPEGLGTAAGDVYALGKTLYEAATGCECVRFPDLPSDLNAGREADALLQLHEIVLTACESDPADRYPSAAAVREALLELERNLATSTARTA